jgi:hypothetical protein
MASWTFREQPKFFDVVTYTGNGTAGRQIAHNLGSVPGCIIVKCTSETTSWRVYHRSLGATKWLQLQATDAADTDSSSWNDTAPTSTHFTVGNVAAVNGGNSQTYVAYLFAHDAGGFGLTGTDNVISCGSYTGNGSTTGPVIDLGYEPQWVMIKNATSVANWVMYDTMRGFTNGGIDATLFPNLSAAEDATNTALIRPLATGFQPTSTSSTRNASGDTYIYIAIRRGPMKTPTTGTSVFNTIVRAGTGAAASITTVGFPPDMMISHSTNVSSNNVGANDKLRGPAQFLSTNTTNAEATLSGTLVSFDQNGFSVGSTASGPFNISGQTNAAWNFRRAPGFFDVVCYTGTGSYPFTINHNLGVVPEMMIFKKRIYDAEQENWYVYQNSITSPNSNWYQNILILNSTTSSGGASSFITTAPTSTAITAAGSLAESGDPWVVYLFASCPGVSKVFSFTGNGSSQTINCGFTGGSRLVLIKRTDSTGNWVIFDSARGIVAGNDPALYLNSTAAEVTGVDAIDTDSTGFIVNQETTFNLNVNNATYIGLAIS